MARSQRITVEIEDVRGSFKRLVRESPKVVKGFMSTAVFLTAAAVQREMESRAPLGPEGEGLTPSEHIKYDIEHRGKAKSLRAQVGLFDPEQAEVGLYNEYAPNEQAFMLPAANAEEGPFKSRAERALEQVERALAVGF